MSRVSVGLGSHKGLWKRPHPSKISSQGPHKAWNHTVSWSVLDLGCQVAISDPKWFLHIVDTQRGNPVGPVCNLRHIRQSAAAFLVTHFWLLTSEVIKRAILLGHWISYQLFYGINSSWERLSWETHSHVAFFRAAFWQHWRCWAGVHSIWGYLLWKESQVAT